MFDTASAKRISDAVKRVEAQAAAGPKGQGRASADLHIWAKVTSSSLVSGVNKHAWTEQVRTAAGFADAAQARTGTTSTDFAIMPDGSKAADNSYVLLRFQLLSDGTSTYTIVGSFLTLPTPRQIYTVLTVINSSNDVAFDTWRFI